MDQDARLQNQMDEIFKRFVTESKCLSMKLDHLASDIKALGGSPSKGAIKIVCGKYQQKEKPCQYH